MQLQKQLQAWENQGKWKRIVKALEKLKPQARDREMNLLLVLAYINSLEGENNKEVFDKIYKIVEPLQKELRNDFSLSFFLSQAIFSLNNYERGKKYFKLAQNANDPASDVYAHVYLNSEIERVLHSALDRLRELKKSGSFSPFPVRVQKAWTMFESQQDDLKTRLNKEFQSQEKTPKKPVPIFPKVLKGVKAKYDKENDRYKIVMTGLLNTLRLFECEYIKDHAPSDVREGWDIAVGKEPVQLSGLDEKQKAKADEIRIWIDKEEDGVFSLSMYADSIHSVHERLGRVDEENLMSTYGSILLGSTGEAVFSKYIRFPQPLTQPRDEPSLTILQFINLLKEKGIDVHAPVKELLNIPTAYTREPKEAESIMETSLRSDIISGWTKSPRFLQDVEGGHYEANEELEENGAIAGYLFYMPDIQNEELKEKELQTLEESIKKNLLDNLSSDDIEIIGEAKGEKANYIDIIAWNPKKVLDLAEKVFKDLPVKMSGFNIFGDSSIGVCLTMKENTDL